MTNDLLVSMGAILPVIVLVGWACVFCWSIWLSRRSEKAGRLPWRPWGCWLQQGLCSPGSETRRSDFGGMVVVDDFANFVSLLLLGSGLAGIALSFDYLKRMSIGHGEYYVLLMFSISGMMLMGMSADLIMVFLALELLSIPLYVLAGIAVPRLSSEEAAIKYFLLGPFHLVFCVWHRAGLWGHRVDLFTEDFGGNPGRFPKSGLAAGWRRLDPGWVGLQGGCGAVPYVDAGCLPGCAIGSDRLHGCGRESGGICRFAAHLRPGISGLSGTLLRCYGGWPRSP